MTKRAGQKQAARVVRERLAQERRRRRTRTVTVSALVALLVAGVVGWAVYALQSPDGYQVPKNADGGTGAVVVGTGPATVDVYLDFLCPSCKRYENAAADTMNRLVADGRATVRYHTVAILDRASTNRYSTRSAAAAACAADGGKFVEYAEALYADQPAEGGPGHENAKLIEMGRSVGLGDDFAGCVSDGRYQSWVRHVTDLAEEQGMRGTPTVRVNGKDIEATPEALTAAVGTGS